MDDYTIEQMSREVARERGWQGGTRTVVATHIQHMLSQARMLINRVDQSCYPEPPPGGEVENARNTLLCMERAHNLLLHAAVELDDERLRLRDGWPA